MPKPIRKHMKGLRRASPSLVPCFEIGPPISKIDIRPMTILAVVLAAITVFFVKPIPHAFYISLWDGETHHYLIDSTAKPGNWLQERPLNRVELTSDDILLWNSEPIDEYQLITLLSDVQRIEPAPILEFEPEGNASYDSTAKLLHIFSASGATFRIAGMEKHCRFTYGRFAHRGRNGSLSIAHTISFERTIEPYHPQQDGGPCQARSVVHHPN